MKKQWQNYQALELMPTSMPEPAPITPWLKPIEPTWRSLVNQLSGDISKPQQVAHLNQCWFLSLQSENSGKTFRSNLSATLGLLWRSMTRDPEIVGSNPYLYARAWDWMVDGQPAVKNRPFTQEK